MRKQLFLLAFIASLVGSVNAKDISFTVVNKVSVMSADVWFINPLTGNQYWTAPRVRSGESKKITIPGDAYWLKMKGKHAPVLVFWVGMYAKSQNLPIPQDGKTYTITGNTNHIDVQVS